MSEIKKLYELLSREGYYSKSEDEFYQRYNNDSDYREKVFNVVSRDGFYSKGKEDFFAKYNGIPVDPPVKKKRRFGIVLGGWFFGASRI